MARFSAGTSLRSCALHQLDAIAEGIEDVRATEVADGRVGACGEASTFACRDNFIEIVHGERGMRAPGGVEIGVGLDAEVQIYRAGHEPDAIASGQRGRLLLLRETENTDVKRTRGFFAASGNRYLDVIEAKDWHRVKKGADRRLPRARRRSNYRAVLTQGTSGWRAGRER